MSAVLLYAICYTKFHRVWEGDFRWSCLASSGCICSCNKYAQYVTVATGMGYNFMRETKYVLEKHAR